MGYQSLQIPPPMRFVASLISVSYCLTFMFNPCILSIFSLPRVAGMNTCSRIITIVYASSAYFLLQKYSESLKLSCLFWFFFLINVIFLLFELFIVKIDKQKDYPEGDRKGLMEDSIRSHRATTNVRFDVISITGQDIVHIENAFVPPSTFYKVVFLCAEIPRILWLLRINFVVLHTETRGSSKKVR